MYNNYVILYSIQNKYILNHIYKQLLYYIILMIPFYVLNCIFIHLLLKKNVIKILNFLMNGMFYS
jgi:hypothetical protein